MVYSTDTIELRKAMLEKGYYTIGAFSKECNVNRATLGKVLSGSIQPTSDVMNKIADCLSISSERAGQIFFSHNLRKM